MLGLSLVTLPVFVGGESRPPRPPRSAVGVFWVFGLLKAGADPLGGDFTLGKQELFDGGFFDGKGWR